MIYIEQPPFLPWLGFCESLLACETVALFDSVQYNDGGWQNRNRIKGPNGLVWVTVPVRKHNGQPLRDVRVAPSFDGNAMLETIRHAYGRTEFYREAVDVITGPIQRGPVWLVDLNAELITSIAAALGSTATLTLTSSLDTTETVSRADRIARICHAIGDSMLWAGEGTRGYLDVGEMGALGVSVVWNEFPLRHPAYRQTWTRQGFIPGLSVVDAACNIGWAGVSALLRQGIRSRLTDHVVA